jgi:hypothetical protein
VYNKYHKKGFEIYALSIDEKKEAWIKALNEENVPWINVISFKGWESENIIQYGVNGIPAGFLISNDGTIVAYGNEVGRETLDKKLEELFKETSINSFLLKNKENK